MQKYKILKDVLDFAKNKFYKHDIENPSLDMAILAAKALGLSKIQLITKEYVSFDTLSISDDKIQKFLYFIELRCKKNSISEILGIKNFYGLDFIVTNDVLTPRPETEILVEKVFNYILKNNINNIIDIGTGSGCIAITVAMLLKKKRLENLKNIKILACDISEKALEVAKKNAKKNGVLDMIEFQKSNLLENINKKYLENACIVTNLPYIPESDAKKMSEEVLNGDPKLALFSGKTGTDLYEKLFTDLFQENSNFYNINSCFFEFDSGMNTENIQKKYYENLLLNKLEIGNNDISFFEDYSGCERFGKILV
ncbi:TPA: peptide chain release factor N(5)-glutamine methyltransferase [Candidatus Peregrinibacteria bacterium]|nr:peptide chain release factor N(5)-glutamine methyltransferase [Candidatus Peregrinibacteria bacterium]HIQ57567.1 peptide chain release factor N(5)-glutamine methyltransferase [Candidatus Gracilibacteria bacterium]